jgi:hypothetical protein
MSLASSIGLNPKNPLTITKSVSIPANAPAFTDINYPTFIQPSASATAPYQLTTAGLTSFNVAEWNALTTANFQLTGVNGGNPVVYELGTFTGGSASTPNTLTMYITPLLTIGGVAQTNTVYVNINAPTLV